MGDGEMIGDVGPKDVPELRTYYPPQPTKGSPGTAQAFPSWLKWGLIGLGVYFAFIHLTDSEGGEEE